MTIYSGISVKQIKQIVLFLFSYTFVFPDLVVVCWTESQDWLRGHLSWCSSLWVREGLVVECIAEPFLKVVIRF